MNVNEWKLSKVAISGELSSLNCSISSVHPWMYGVGNETNSGKYLSPVNAVNHLSTVLASATDNSDVMILLITGDSEADFINQLSEMTDVLPVPSLMQIKRLAQSTAQLAAEKMQIPAPLVSAASPVAALSIESTRTAINAMAVERAQAEAKAGFSMDGLIASIDSFSQAKDRIMSEIELGLEELRGKSASAWVFTGQGNVLTSITGMLKNIPAPSSVHCAAVMFTGEDLAAIRGMIHEYESNTGT